MRGCDDGMSGRDRGRKGRRGRGKGKGEGEEIGYECFERTRGVERRVGKWTL